jgi:hypothetical protein
MRKTALLAVMAVLTLSACSDVSEAVRKAASDKFEDQSGNEILTESYDAMGTLTSVHIVGEIEDPVDGDLSLDLRLDDEGHCSGWIDDGTGKLEVLVNDTNAYLKATPEVIESSMGLDAETAQFMGNKWLLLPPADAASFAEVCSLDEFLGDIASDDMVADLADAGDVSEIDGEKVVAVTNPLEDGSEEIIYVQVDGEHYAVKITSEEPFENITFAEFNEDYNFPDPPKDEILDLS